MSSSPKNWLHQQLLTAPNKWFSHSPAELNSLTEWNKPNTLSAENLAEWKAYLEPFNPSNAVLKQLDKLHHSNALCVVAGQQAGLLGGPLLTIYKALSALQWAQQMEQKLKRPVVPVFWIASDDHDFAEIAPLHWMNANQSLSTTRITQREEDLGKSVSDSMLISQDWIFLLQKIKDSVSSLSSSSGSRFVDIESEYSSLIEEFNSFTLNKTSTVEDQFLHFFLRWFASLGIVPLAPKIPFIRRGAVRLYQHEIANPKASTSQLILAEDELTAQGLQNAGIHRKGAELNFFWHNEHGRCRLEWIDSSKTNDSPKLIAAYHPISGKAVWEGIAKNLEELLFAKPEAFSPNAALRPLLQDYLLPTVAFIGGPIELVYHGQLAQLYPLFNVKRPVCVPRVSITIFPKPFMRYLAKFNLTPEQLINLPIHEIEALLAERVDDERALATVDESFTAIEFTLDHLEAKLEKINDSRIIEYTQKLREYLVRGRKKIQTRATQTLSARAHSQELHWAQIKETLFPNGAPQERVLNCFPFLHQQLGADAVSRLNATLDATAWQQHQIIDCVHVPELSVFVRAPQGTTP